MKKILLGLVLGLGVLIQTKAQSDLGGITGNFQVDAQSYKEDSTIGAQKVDEQIRSNAFLNLIYTKGKFSAGIRYETYLKEILGFDSRWAGPNGNGFGGIPFRYARYTDDLFEVTAGSFYEQIGTGMILRSYEERGLGLDNALDGVRLKLYPIAGVRVTGMIGRQRSFFDFGPGLVRAVDADVNTQQLWQSLFDTELLPSTWQLSIGGGATSKFQKDPGGEFILPQNVLAWSGRFNFVAGDIALQGEYAYKANDPTSVNVLSNPTALNYNPGHGLFLSGAYSTAGLGVSLSYKTVDNMDFRSDRNSTLTNLVMNFLPALTKQYTYRLLTLYPYATQPNGEVAIQADVQYTFEKGSLFGGEYGTNINFNYSLAKSTDTTRNSADPNRYNINFASFGSTKYFEDINIEIQKKWSKKIKTNIGYMNQYYNKEVAEGRAGFGIVKSHVFVGEISYKISPTNSIRMEVQHLWADYTDPDGTQKFDSLGFFSHPKTDRNNGNWAYMLIEYSIAPSWFFSIFDEYNYNNKSLDSPESTHYYSANVVYNTGATRVQLGYGRVRGGILCVGGVCRFVPASNGISVSVSSSF